MPRKLRKEAFKNPIIAEGMTSSKTRYVEGKKVSVEGDDYQIQRGMKILADNKAIHRGDKKQPESTKYMCILGAFGCSISSEDADFSLLTDQTDQEEVESENIMPDYSKIKNKNMKATKSFKNENDPFYTLDERRPRKMQQQLNVQKLSMDKASSTAVKSIAANLIKNSISQITKNTKY